MSGSRCPLVVIGDALLDRDVEGRVERLSPEAPVPVVDEVAENARPGGAGLAAALAAAEDRPVTLITALAADPAGRRLSRELEQAGVRVVDLGLAGRTPEKIRIRADGRSLLRVDRGGAERGPVGPPTAAAHEALRSAAGVLVADYGRGVAASPGMREAVGALGGTPVVWDPHPRGEAPVAGVTLATPNRSEARLLTSSTAGEGLEAVAAQAHALRRRWRAVYVCVTMGGDGALMVGGAGPPLVVPVRPVDGSDACGAGDRFASRAAALLADGALPSEAVAAAAEAAATFVAAGGAAAARSREAQGPPPESERPAAEALVASVRARGGTVVATGGCFDLLHAGHVSMLRAARELGDCLVVCLNSDTSVRRLKGPDRPLVKEGDRAAVLQALSPVDAVAVFDEDTPEALLDRLRPDVWAKGGDYALAELPEARLVESWGGQAVILPYVAGRSTSGLIEEVGTRG